MFYYFFTKVYKIFNFQKIFIIIMKIIKEIIKEELLNEGFFKDLINKIFRINDETDVEKLNFINKITSELKKNNVYNDEISSLLEGISSSENIENLDFDLFSRTIGNVLLKKGNKTANMVKHLNNVLNSLESRTAYVEELPAEEYYEPEESETSLISRKQYNKEKYALQVELLKMQEWLKKIGGSVIVVFEGRDTAGKGSTIRKFTEHLDPKFYKVVVKGVPTVAEKSDWFGRYKSEIEPGKIIFFDRSWYNRGIVEPVMGYSSYEEYESFMAQVKEFEKELVSSGNYLIKFWLSVTKETQARRFKMRQTSPLAYWKYSPNDARAQEKWEEYTKYKNRVLKLTSTSYAPWVIVDSNDKRISGLNAMRYVLSEIPYEDKNEMVIGSTYPEAVTRIR